jgi:hypothetical protein
MKAALIFYMCAATVFFLACAVCLCFGGCVWRNLEGDTYLSLPSPDPWECDGPQIQLNRQIYYR